MILPLEDKMQLVPLILAWEFLGLKKYQAEVTMVHGSSYQIVSLKVEWNNNRMASRQVVLSNKSQREDHRLASNSVKITIKMKKKKITNNTLEGTL